MFKHIEGGDLHYNFQVRQNCQSLGHALNELSSQPLMVTVCDRNYSYSGDFADEEVTDLRWSPLFRREWKEPQLLDADHVKITRGFASHDFFEACRKAYRRDPDDFSRNPLGSSDEQMCVSNHNTWLALVDHYGFDADYRPDFIHYADRMRRLMTFEAYVPEGEQSGRCTKRFFHGQEYSRADFVDLFRKFLNRYPPVTFYKSSPEK